MRRYDEIGHTYSQARRTDPRVEARIRMALGEATTVLNVGAGTGSYEPSDRPVVAVEPSTTMLGQRPIAGPPAVQAVAEALPFRAGSFDASMAVLTVHHWTSLGLGLSEMGRVSDRQVVFLFEPSKDADFWLVTDYLPVWLDLDAVLPTVADLAQHLEVRSVEVVPVPDDCVDGFGGAYWNRPERYLDPQVQAGISSLARMDPAALAAAMDKLRAHLESGLWDARHGHLRELSELDLGYRLVTAGR